jgi:hypothetical protein
MVCRTHFLFSHTKQEKQSDQTRPVLAIPTAKIQDRTHDSDKYHSCKLYPKKNLTRRRAKTSTHQESDDLFQVQKRSTPHCSCTHPASGQLYAICHDPPIQLWYFTFPTAAAIVIEKSETSVSTLLNPRQKLLITASWS